MSNGVIQKDKINVRLNLTFVTCF